jgi:tetraacyldisaccharide 4'-kinase
MEPSSVTAMTRGAAGVVEASWSGAPGTLAWTRLFAHAAALYGVAAAGARRRAAATRRRVPGVRVIAVGNLTVGGTGKSSLARWLATEAARRGRAAVLLRGHGSRGGAPRPTAVPDFLGYPLALAAERSGDEAAAHRAALPPAVAVIVDPDRHAGALLARDGHGASTAILDDGWEQGTLAWDELWVTIDPERPEGNGDLLPAGPLRRPASTLNEAAVLAFVLEGPGTTVPERTLEWAAWHAPRARVARFRRVLLSESGGGNGAEGGGLRAGLMTGVGAPRRVAAFAAASGYAVVADASFPDHARVGPERLRGAMLQAARRGAEVILITEKDEHRWALPSDPPLPVRVLRTGLAPLDPTGE